VDTTSIRRMYDRFSAIPGFWELDAWVCRATAHSPYRARIVDRLGLTSSSRVLDVACGTGLGFPLLQAALGEGGQIVGIDNSEKTLDHARRVVKRRRWRNVELVVADAAMYRPQGSFDAALCTFAIDIVPRWPEVIGMMIDAVRPGGRVAFIGFQPSSRRPYRIANPLWRRIASLFGGVDLDRQIRRQVATRCDEIYFDEGYGGFYYLLVAAVRGAPR
jgi:ubiquinone/menaquinone biosynthesis C-methylase UbiE